MTIELDGRRMTDRQTTHAYLQQALELPEYYGKNLDALYDILTERAEPVELVVTHWKAMGQQLGGYAVSLLETLRQASEENPRLEVTLTDAQD